MKVRRTVVRKKNRNKLIFISLIAIVFSLNVAANTYTFNTCGNDGRFGPDSGDCNYGGENSVDIEGNGIQIWEVPQEGDYMVEAQGASGGGSHGGRGAVIEEVVSLNEGEEVQIAVGQPGRDGAHTSASGGGGTFIMDSSNNPLAIAGGGGADTGPSSDYSDTDGQAGTSGADGAGGSGGSATEGGGDTTRGGGGGGTQEDGDDSCCSRAGGGQSFVNGALGGEDIDDRPEPGGFGGGGASSSRGSGTFQGTGGGGGYGGGGAGRTSSGDASDHYAGGGGSLGDRVGRNSGSGSVKIELLTDPDDPIIQTPIVEYKEPGDNEDNPSWIELDFDVDIDDDGGSASDNVLEECVVTVTGQENGGTEVYSDSNPSGDSCNFIVENDDNSIWEDGENLDIEVEVEDTYGGTDYLFRGDRSFPESFDRVWTSDHGNDLESNSYYHRGPVITMAQAVEVTGLTGSHFGGSNGRVDVGIYTYDESCGDNNLCETLAFQEFYADGDEDERRTTKPLDDSIILNEGYEYVITMGRANGVDTMGEIDLDHDSFLSEEVVADWDPEDSNYAWSSNNDQPAETLPDANDESPEETSIVWDKGFTYDTDLPEPTYSNPTPSESTDTSPVGTLDPDISLLVNHEVDRELDVTFYEGSSGSDQLGEVFNIEPGDVASYTWSNRENEQSYTWSAEICDSESNVCTSTDEYTFEVIKPNFNDPYPAESTSTSPVNTLHPELGLEVSHPDDEEMEVTFYDGSPGSAQIGPKQEGLLSGETATVEWINRENNEQYEWSAIIEDESGATTETQSWIFEVVIDEAEITDIEFEDSYEDHEFDVVAEIDPGEHELIECNLEATDSTFFTNDYVGDISEDEETCTVSDIRYDDLDEWQQRHDEDDELIELDLEIEIEDEEGLRDQVSSSHQFPNNPPEFSLDESNFEDYDDRHAFNISAFIEFPDNKLHEPAEEACIVELEGDQEYYSSNGSESDDFDVEFTHVSGDLFECSFSRVEPQECESGSGCDGGFDFDVLEDIEVIISAVDHHGGINQESYTKAIPNRNPQVDSLLSPTGSVVFDDEVSLEVEVSDPEEDPFNLTFFNESPANELHFVENAGQGTNPEYEWDIDLGTYTWGVLMEDDYGTSQETWTFIRSLSETIRLEKEVQNRYSSIIISERGTSNVFMNVRNGFTEELQYTTAVESDSDSLTANIIDYDEDIYELEPRESRRFQISINSSEIEESTDTTLIFTSEEQNTGSVTRKEFPVHIRKSEAEQRGVPGLTSIYLLFIGLAASVLFGLSVW